MKKLVLVGCLLFASATLCAESNPYVKAYGGYNNMSLDSTRGGVDFGGDGYSLGLGVGNNFSDRFRGDISYTFIETHNHSGDHHNQHNIWGHDIGHDSEIKQQLLLINAYYYPLKKRNINPFVGAGAGWGFFDGDGVDENNLAYAVYLGLDFDMSNKISLEIAGNYSSILAPASWLENLYNLGITAGLRFKF